MLSSIAGLAARIGHARTRLLLVLGGLLLGVILAVATTWFVITLRTTAIADAEREMRNDALMLADEEDRLIQAVDMVQLSLIEHMRQLGVDSPEVFEQIMASKDAHQYLSERIAGLSYIGGLFVSARNGRLLNYSRPWPVPSANDSQRDFIRALKVPNPPQTFISEPSLSKATGEWTIYFSRRFEAADGELIGFVICTIQMSYFEQSYARLPLTGGGAYSLYRRDGILMARYPNVDPQVGRTFANTTNFANVHTALNGGVVRLKSQLDGKERLAVPRAMAHFPLIITVSDTMDSILQPWREQTRGFVVVTSLLELVIAATVLLALRHLRGYEILQKVEAARSRAEAELILAREREHAARALHTQERRFDTALHNLLQGLLMVSKSGQLLVVNHRFNELFGVPPGSLRPGMTYQELTDRIVELGNVSAEDMAGVRERRATLIENSARATITWELSDGRVFNMTHLPMDDGWLATFEDISERRAAEAKIVHLAHHDALTGQPNRVLFHAKLVEALAFARRGYKLALLCLDLDQFKAVNDTLGHPIGDALLQAVAQRLSGTVRETDMVARLGGDEFAIIQTTIGKPTEATAFAARLIDLLHAPFDIEGHHIVVGTSIGIAFAPEDGLDSDELLRCADLALYRAKTDGRGVYRLFQREMDAQMQARRLLELDLRQALSAGQFEVFYQPVVDLRASAMTGVEALVRWRHPERGLISPAQFIPLAEEIGLIVPLGEWVLRTACAVVAAWPGALHVAVNLSPAQFKNRNVVASVAQALRDANLPADRLELEITETVMLQDTDATLATLRQLRDLGVRTAMDDFGTGYSSLSYLRRFPFDRIKIDQSFVRELSNQRDCGAIIRAVTGLSRELGMATTAEGVETAEQLDLLVRAGCNEFQGYLFSPAVTENAIPALRRSIAEMLQPMVAQSELVAAE